MKRLILILAIVVSGTLWLPMAAQADFGITSFSTGAFNRDGTVNLRAGTHPFEFQASFTMNQNEAEEAEGTLSAFVVDLPPGLVGNPLALPRCRAADFEGQNPICPGNTQVGIANVQLLGSGSEIPVYNLTPPQGVAASIGFTLASVNSFQEGSVRSTDYGISVSDITLPTDIGGGILGAVETIWGVPADPAHDAQRRCIVNGSAVIGCASDVDPVPFLTLPTSCTGPLKTTFSVESLEEPGVQQSKTAESLGEGGVPEGLNGCERPDFDPSILAQPDTSASDSPTGLHFGLHIPQNNGLSKDAEGTLEGTATAHLKDAVVTLPRGFALNPSTANGLGACSLAQIELKGPEPARCPGSSKVGDVVAETPLLDHPVNGSVYITRQGENPFDSLIALYIALEDPITGVVVKLAGKVEPDPVSGQLRTTFKQNPQLPVEDFDFDFFGGPRAPLTTPPTCGTYTTTSQLTPWTSPEGKDAFPSDSFQITGGPGGGCAPSEAQMPNSPSLSAGTTLPLAASYSPFVLQLSRENGSQRLGAVSATLPPGLTGKLAGVAQCSDAKLAVAASRTEPGDGALEKQSPSCSAASQIGTVTVGAGSGTPLHVQGKAYLAGPYKGAPLSLAIVTPAVAGPFDLGTVLVRASAYVDPKTAQITVKSDPIPTILEGIPLDVRSVAVNIDRDRFTLNPTNCEPMSLGVDALSSLGQSALLSNPFQVGGCRGLDFEPKLNLRLKGGTKRGANPKLIATVKAKEGEANIARASVKLPRSAFLDQAHIRTVCTRVQFAAEACPKGSIYGKASATTPLLDEPLSGNVYLRSSNNKLPDLVVDLRGPASLPIRIELAGRTDSVKGALRNTFDLVPDAPVSKFRLELLGGKRGLVVNSTDICSRAFRATVKLRAHSGAAHEARPVVQNDCRKRGKRQRKGR
jgi:hypothetical protein